MVMNSLIQYLPNPKIFEGGKRTIKLLRNEA